MTKQSTGKLAPNNLYQSFVKNGVDYFCGVPDSLLSSFGFYLEEHAQGSHDIAVNEGNAVAIAIGHYLATSKVPLVYMQNSGLGNALNPLVSLASTEVLGIPMILLIGWRGQPNTKDEPQHRLQGLLTIPLLEILSIPYMLLSRDVNKIDNQIKKAVREALKSKQAYAIVVQPNTLEPYKRTSKPSNVYVLSREKAIGLVINSLDEPDAVIATTGKTSRELFEHRERNLQNHKDLLVIGGMGHASSIALGISQQKQNRKVYCIDGDGAILMHMGALASIGTKSLKNFYHIVINNGSHESVGGQPTAGFDIGMTKIAKACGYKHTYLVHQTKSLKDVLKKIKKLEGPILVEIRVNMNVRKDLARPTIPPSHNKKTFMSFLDKD